MSRSRISVGSESPIELTLLALAIMSEGSSSVVRTDAMIRDEPTVGDRLELELTGRVGTIASRPPSFRVHSEGQATDQPWFLPVNPPRAERTGSGRLRIGIAGGSDTRRLKMSWRALAELKKRNIPATTIVVGDCELSGDMDERPDELHVALAPAEYIALLDRLDVVLECTDSFSTESFLAVAARDRGVPVVAHHDRPDLAVDPGWRSEMWSADGFVEALTAAPKEQLEPRDTTKSLRELMELLEG